jgi:hypothetical protein
VFAYLPPLGAAGHDAVTHVGARRRHAAPPSALRLVLRAGEGLAGNVLPIAGFTAYDGNDHVIATVHGAGAAHVVLSPRGLVGRGWPRADGPTPPCADDEP